MVIDVLLKLSFCQETKTHRISNNRQLSLTASRKIQFRGKKSFRFPVTFPGKIPVTYFLPRAEDDPFSEYTHTHTLKDENVSCPDESSRRNPLLPFLLKLKAKAFPPSSPFIPGPRELLLARFAIIPSSKASQ